ncbi:MAG TPA: ABC transporter permease [Longimicrobiales bacterium]
MDDLIQDLKVALRRLARDPLFSAVAVLTLGVGIGANSAIFTLVNGVLLRPLPFRAPDELVQIEVKVDGEATGVASPAAFRAMRDRSSAFSGVALMANTGGTLTGAGEPEVITGAGISGNYFDVTGVPPLHGRVFTTAENEPGNTNVVLLSEALWRGRFGADPTILGRSILLDDVAREVVGVMPASASFPPELEFWIPFEYSPRFNNPNALYGVFLRVVARLKPGVTLEQADADAVRVMELAKQDAAQQLPNWSAGVSPLRDRYVGRARQPLLLLLGAVGLVLLIACANLANLLLAQAAARSTDFAVRRALGASSVRLIRQLTAESVVLGLGGGATGLLLGAWAADALLALMPPSMPQMPGISIDGRVVTFTLIVSLGSALLFGMAPALQTRRAELASTLREGGRGLAGRAGARTRSALVLAETALAFALVIAAGLLIRSFDELRSVDPGFRTDNNLAFELLLPATRYGDDARVAAFWSQLDEQLRAVPGVTAVGGINGIPLGGNVMTITFTVDGRPAPEPGAEEVMDVRVVTPGFFEAMGVPLRAGRLFNDADRAGAAPVVLLSEVAVERHFPNENPIGKRITMGWQRTEGTQVSGEVVGVVGAMRHGDLREAAEPEIYFPVAQLPLRSLDITVATTLDPATLGTALRTAVTELDPALAPARLRPMSEVVAASMARDRFMTLLLTAFSAVALLLAAIGIFGVISYSVTQRRREIGVRMAIGASRSDVIRLIVGGGLRLAGAGVLVGMVAAAATSRLLQSLLFGIGAFDPATFLAAGIVLITVAFIASALPAWRASRTPPASVLNTE